MRDETGEHSASSFHKGNLPRLRASERPARSHTSHTDLHTTSRFTVHDANGKQARLGRLMRHRRTRRHVPRRLVRIRFFQPVGHIEPRDGKSCISRRHVPIAARPMAIRTRGESAELVHATYPSNSQKSTCSNATRTTSQGDAQIPSAARACRHAATATVAGQAARRPAAAIGTTSTSWWWYEEKEAPPPLHHPIAQAAFHADIDRRQPLHAYALCSQLYGYRCAAGQSPSRGAGTRMSQDVRTCWEICTPLRRRAAAAFLLGRLLKKR